MLHTILTPSRIQTVQHVASWEESIRIAAQPLVSDGSVEERYVSRMVENVHAMGPYIVIAPHLAFAHARPDDGVNALGFSLLRVQEGVPFSDAPHHHVYLVLVLAAPDNTSHLTLLSSLSHLFSDEHAVSKMASLSESELLSYLKQGETQ